MRRQGRRRVMWRRGRNERASTIIGKSRGSGLVARGWVDVCGAYLSLNCLMMLEIFSKRCTSECTLSVACEMTRNVAFSNSTICTT